ncbi:MAG: carbohydrate kinase family protein [Clostridia bacterium]|nr:carbohydrate kinase family protein [Clostridia bacterium]
MKKGIAFAGNILVDVVKTIEGYPRPGMLAGITAVSQAVGGCVPNTAIDVAKMDPSVPVSAYGRVGDDAYGRYVTEQMAAHGIDVAHVLTTAGVPTSFSDVMSDISSGERTFFHARGANALFSPDDIDPDTLDCRIFHIGYILLLDIMDEPDDAYGTKLARLLAKVQSRGIKTSIDAVSDSTGWFREKIVPALRYCDYAVMNEIEGCGVSGLEPRHPDGSLHMENIRTTMELMLSLGVRERVILHSPEAGFMLTADGVFRHTASIHMDPSGIAGKVGAGDAFCAGCLYGLYTGMADEDLLAYAAAAAACNLTAADSVSGMRPAADVSAIAACGRLV